MDFEFLPIGSVVMLKNGNKAVMVNGYLLIPSDDKEKMYDYSACIYPEGVLTSEQSFAFNHENIDKVLFRGYETDEYKKLLPKLVEIKNNKNNKDSNVE